MPSSGAKYIHPRRHTGGTTGLNPSIPLIPILTNQSLCTVSEREQRDGVPELPPHRDGLDGVLPGALSAVRPAPAWQVGGRWPRTTRPTRPRSGPRGKKRKTKEGEEKARSPMAEEEGEKEMGNGRVGIRDDPLLTFDFQQTSRQTHGRKDRRTDRQGHFCRVAAEARRSGLDFEVLFAASLLHN